jgi:protoheme IX farnesyltransferase
MTAKASEKVKALWEMTKPLQLFLLSVTLFGSYFAAGGRPDAPITLALLAVAAVGGIGGVTALNMIIERDIDSIMDRTASRPIPAGILSVGEATASVMSLIIVGLIAAASINRYVAFAVLLGAVFDIILYTNIAKRRTPINIILGGVAGGAPALGGWAAARGTIDAGGLILSAIVMAWIPMHIWFISYYYRSDYAKAGIPMAPVVLSTAEVARLINLSLIIMILLSWLFVAVEGYGILASSLLTLLALVAVRKVEEWRRNPSRETARSLFKFASPIIAVFYFMLPIDYWIVGVIL